MDFGNDHLNKKFREIHAELKRLYADRRKLAIDMPEEWRYAYGITGDKYALRCEIAAHLTARIFMLKKDLAELMNGFKPLPWNRNRVLITKSYTHHTGRGANRVYAERDGHELETQTIFHSGFPKKPSKNALLFHARRMAKKFNLPIQNNLDETGFNHQLIYEK